MCSPDYFYPLSDTVESPLLGCAIGFSAIRDELLTGLRSTLCLAETNLRSTLNPLSKVHSNNLRYHRKCCRLHKMLEFSLINLSFSLNQDFPITFFLIIKGDKKFSIK